MLFGVRGPYEGTGDIEKETLRITVQRLIVAHYHANNTLKTKMPEFCSTSVTYDPFPLGSELDNVTHYCPRRERPLKLTLGEPS